MHLPDEELFKTGTAGLWTWHQLYYNWRSWVAQENNVHPIAWKSWVWIQVMPYLPMARSLDSKMSCALTEGWHTHSHQSLKHSCPNKEGKKSVLQSFPHVLQWLKDEGCFLQYNIIIFSIYTPLAQQFMIVHYIVLPLGNPYYCSGEWIFFNATANRYILFKCVLKTFWYIHECDGQISIPVDTYQCAIPFWQLLKKNLPDL